MSVTPVLSGWTRAHRVLPTLVIALVIATAIRTVGETTFAGATRVPVRSVWLLTFAQVVILAAPLVDAFGVLDRCAVRIRQERLLRVLTVALILGLTAALTGGIDAFGPIATWLILCSALTLAVMPLLGQRAVWLVSLLAALSILVDHYVATLPVSGALFTIGPGFALAMWVGAAAAFVFARPRAEHDA